MPRHHDMGGQPGDPIDLSEHEAEPWAKMLTAVRAALGGYGHLRVDELRRSMEDLPTEVYDSGYFQRWAEAMCNLMQEKGLLTRDEVEQRMTEIKGRLESRT